MKESIMRKPKGQYRVGGGAIFVFSTVV